MHGVHKSTIYGCYTTFFVPYPPHAPSPPLLLCVSAGMDTYIRSLVRQRIGQLQSAVSVSEFGASIFRMYLYADSVCVCASYERSYRQ